MYKYKYINDKHICICIYTYIHKCIEQFYSIIYKHSMDKALWRMSKKKKLWKVKHNSISFLFNSDKLIENKNIIIFVVI